MKEEIHGRRLKFFRNKSFEVSEEIIDHLKYQEGELLVIESFEDIRSHNGAPECLVKWRGFPKEESDWVLYSSLKEDVPEFLEEFITEITKSGTKRQRLIVSSL